MSEGFDPGDAARSVPAAWHQPTAGLADPAGRRSRRRRRRRRPGRRVALGLLVVGGLAGVGGGGTGLALELTRPATKAELAGAVQAEIASRWQRLRAGKIFPETIAYATNIGGTTTARLVGIARPSGCAAALDPPAARLLRRYGCMTVLRATYLDGSGTLAVTAGIAVMPSASAAGQAVSAWPRGPAGSGVRTFSLPGTVADLFGNPQRRVFSPIQSIGPYVFFYAAGYTDGRVSGSATSTPGLVDLGSGVVTSVQTVLTIHGSACKMPDIRC